MEFIYGALAVVGGTLVLLGLAEKWKFRDWPFQHLTRSNRV